MEAQTPISSLIIALRALGYTGGGVAPTGALLAVNNLSDVDSIPAAQANLGIVPIVQQLATNSTLTTFPLPLVAPVGSQFTTINLGAGGWRISQATGQLIIFGSQQTSVGESGYLQSSNYGDSVTLQCVTANTIWAVVASQGQGIVVN